MLKSKRKKKQTGEEPKIKQKTIDILDEQLDRTDTTRLSDDAEFDLSKVEAHPERYIEINIIKKSRVVDTFFIFADKPHFTYNKKKYDIDEEGIYLLPKSRFFVPTSFYYEDIKKPIGFRQTNKGITGKAMTLLYKNRLYQQLLKTDDQNYNVFVIILLIAQMILFAVALWFLFNPPSGAGGGIPII